LRTEEINVCIMRVGGTNCDEETRRAFLDLKVNANVYHLNEIVKKSLLSEAHILVIPGGFSYGDYVRAGAILARKIISKLGKDLKRFIEDEKPILGICNGFQVLVEAGLLPGFNGDQFTPQASLATNVPTGYRCQWVFLRNENRGNCVFTCKIPYGSVLRIPIAHAEGRFIFPKNLEDEYLKRLYDGDQIVFRYCDEAGEPADGVYPINPNGSFHDIAGICSPNGVIFGLMPHPERAYYGWQKPDWTREGKPPKYADGRLIFESVIDYILRNF